MKQTLSTADQAYYNLLYEGREPGKIVVPKQSGILKRHIQGMNTFLLSHVYQGLHQLYVPLEMRALENPSEIFANYLAASLLKRDNYHREGDAPREHFGDLVQWMNNTAYNYPGFRAFVHTIKDSERFPTKPGSQQKRLHTLSGKTKYEFCKSFFRLWNSDFFEPRSKTSRINTVWKYFQDTQK